jgi:hypothetical protein
MATTMQGTTAHLGSEEDILEAHFFILGASSVISFAMGAAFYAMYIVVIVLFRYAMCEAQLLRLGD